MISIQDCIGFSGLSSEQVDRLSGRFHRPAVVITEWAETIYDLPGGPAALEELLASDEVYTSFDPCLAALERCRRAKPGRRVL